MKKIIYKDKVRDVVVIAKPTDNYFMFDLSEYSDSEKEYYEGQFNLIHENYLAEIKELGLSSNYRYFKENKLEWVEDETEKLCS